MINNENNVYNGLLLRVSILWMMINFNLWRDVQAYMQRYRKQLFCFPKFRAVPWRFLVPLLSGNHFVPKRFQKQISASTCIVTNVGHAVSNIGSKQGLRFYRRYWVKGVKHSYETGPSLNMHHNGKNFVAKF